MPHRHSCQGDIGSPVVCRSGIIKGVPRKPARQDSTEPELTDDEIAGLGARIREARGEMSQTALGEQIGVGQAYVSRLESGARAPGLAVLIRIARATGQPLGWLAANEGPGPVVRPPVAFEQRDRRRRKTGGE